MASPAFLLRPAASARAAASSFSPSSALASSSSSSSSGRRSLSSSAPRAVRQPDEWSYPSKTGDNRPRRPFLNPDVSERIPNEVARRNGLPPYRLPSANLDPYELPPKLPIKHDILTHSITFSAFDHESLRPYAAMARHTALALSIPITGPVSLPNELVRWSSNKSPFVHAKSKQVFERRTYAQRMDVWDADDKAAEVLVKVLLATGRGEYVKVKVEKYSRDKLDMDIEAPPAPLFHKTERARATVADIAARFVARERAELEREAKAAAEPEEELVKHDDWQSATVEGKVIDLEGGSGTQEAKKSAVQAQNEVAGQETGVEGDLAMREKKSDA